MGTTFCGSGKFHGGLSPRTKNVRLTLERGAQEVQAHPSFRIVEDIDEETIMGHRLHKLNAPRRKITGQEVSSSELLTKAERHTIKAKTVHHGNTVFHFGLCMSKLRLSTSELSNKFPVLTMALARPDPHSKNRSQERYRRRLKSSERSS